MFPGLSTLFLILSGMEFLIKILGNVFIGLVLCSECVKNQKTSLLDFILTGLAIFRISQLLVYFLQSLITGLDPQVFAIFKLAKPISLLWRISNHLTTWLVTCLSIFYLLKIAHFSHSLFFWLKWRMNRVILVMLAFSLVFLILDILLLETFSDLFWNLINEGNLTLAESKTYYIKSEILLSFSYFIPIVLSLLSLFFFFFYFSHWWNTLEICSSILWVPGTSAQRPIKEPWKWWRHSSSLSWFIFYSHNWQIGCFIGFWTISSQSSSC